MRPLLVYVSLRIITSSPDDHPDKLLVLILCFRVYYWLRFYLRHLKSFSLYEPSLILQGQLVSVSYYLGGAFSLLLLELALHSALGELLQFSIVLNNISYLLKHWIFSKSCGVTYIVAPSNTFILVPYIYSKMSIELYHECVNIIKGNSVTYFRKVIVILSHNKLSKQVFLNLLSKSKILEQTSLVISFRDMLIYPYMASLVTKFSLISIE